MAKKNSEGSSRKAQETAIASDVVSTPIAVPDAAKEKSPLSLTGEAELAAQTVAAIAAGELPTPVPEHDSPADVPEPKKPAIDADNPEDAPVEVPEHLKQDVETRKRANTYFFGKMVVNIFLVVLGAVLIGLFLRQMQNAAALQKQEETSREALAEAVRLLETNSGDAAELTRVFHDGNQDMVDDLKVLLNSGLFDSLAEADNEARAEVMADMVARTGVDYLFVLGDDGTILMAPHAAYYGMNVVDADLITPDNLEMLTGGTRSPAGLVFPVMENNDYGYFYFYSTRLSFQGNEFNLVLGAEGDTLDLQIASLKDVSVVLSRAGVGNGGFMFAVDRESETFVYYENGSEILTGENALEAGLSKAALQDGYAGIETINGVKYHCTSKSFGTRTVICAVADTDEIFVNDRYVLFWSILGFVLVMMLCLSYAVIIRNDFVRNAVVTERRVFHRRDGSNVYFDKSIFKKVFPLTVAGVLIIFGISFYTQTLLEISQAIEKSELALDEVTARYEESTENRVVIQDYYDNRFLAKARLIAYLLEEDPSLLNEPSLRYYSVYDEDGNKQFLLDDEGNRLKSVVNSERLREICESNDLDDIYVYNEDGRTIATSSTDWFFTISHDPAAQSYPFLEVLDGKRDFFVQEPMVSDMGEAAQYMAVAFTYYTSVDAQGNTIYVSRYTYQAANGEMPVAESGLDLGIEDEAALAAAEAAIAQSTDVIPAGPITMHRSMVQVGLDRELTAKLLASTDVGYVLSSNLLSGGFIVLFDATENHTCIYSPIPARIGMSAAEIGLSPNAFSGNDYYGFTTVAGTNYFQYFRYADGYFVATAIPRDGMFQARFIIALITALVSLLLILLLSGTVTLTNDEEEALYATMSETEAKKGLDSAIFRIVMPSGASSSTMRASARWDNKRIPWRERSPEQKLLLLLSVLGVILVFYVIVSVLGVKTFFGDGSTVQYILSGNWDRGMNIFALSACVLVLIFVAIAVAVFRVLVRIVTSLLGARGETVGHLLLSVVKYGGAIGALFYCLYLVGVDSTSLLASAGILSLVIGLGSQSLIKDIIAGIFIVFEGEFRVGDIVTIGGYRGTVLDIGLRTTKVMGVDGNIKIYNNSEISGVLNMTKEASVAVANIQIAYGQDIEYVEEVLAREMPAIKENNPKVLDGPTYLGVAELGDSGVTLRVICKCYEKDIKGVARYLNRELLQIFYRNGITVPFPHVTVVQQDNNSAEQSAEEAFRKERAKAAKDEFLG